MSESVSDPDPEENSSEDASATVSDNNGISLQNDNVTSVSRGDVTGDLGQNPGANVGQSADVNSEVWQEPETFEKAYWKKNHTKVKGIYVTGPMAGSSGMKSLIELCDKTELNAMVIDIKDENGNITFRMPEETEPAVLGNCKNYIGDMDALMKELREHEIYTIARIVCFKDPALAKEKPELAIKDKNGKFVTDSSKLPWVDPCKEETWEYLTDIALYCADTDT